MTWPAQSPDLNIIENLRLRIKRSLQNGAGNINTPQELFTAIQNIWMNFTVDYIQNLYTSIPRRILAIIRSKGYLTWNILISMPSSKWVFVKYTTSKSYFLSKSYRGKYFYSTAPSQKYSRKQDGGRQRV
jgi:hypothetical protein